MKFVYGGDEDRDQNKGRHVEETQRIGRLIANLVDRVQGRRRFWRWLCLLKGLIMPLKEGQKWRARALRFRIGSFSSGNPHFPTYYLHGMYGILTTHMVCMEVVGPVWILGVKGGRKLGDDLALQGSNRGCLDTVGPKGVW